MYPQINPSGLPTAHGLYDPRFEHDACGVSFVADIKGRASHDIVMRGLGALCNMEHRGAVAADGKSGDGAGVLTQLPLALNQEKTGHLPFPKRGKCRQAKSCSYESEQQRSYDHEGKI